MRIVLAGLALGLLAVGAVRISDRMERPAPPVAKTALITGSAAAPALHEWYPPARVPAGYRAMAAKLDN